MNVVAHQAPAQQVQVVADAIVSQYFEMPRAVAIGKEEVLPIIAASGDVMGGSRYHKSGTARHEQEWIFRARFLQKMSPVPFSAKLPERKLVPVVKVEMVQRIFLLAMFASALSAIGWGQQPSLNDVPEPLARMASTDLATRHAALDDMVAILTAGQDPNIAPGYSDILANFFARYPEQTEGVKLGLIGLLSADNTALNNPPTTPGTYTENDAEHWAMAIYFVAGMQDDRAIPALVGAIETDVASRGLVKYGRKALTPVLKELNNPDRLVQACAFLAATEILRANSDPGMHADLLRLVTASLTDRNDLIRQDALWVIDEKMPISDQRQLAPTLEQVARLDPFAITGPTGERLYPNRATAQRLLDAIKSH